MRPVISGTTLMVLAVTMASSVRGSASRRRRTRAPRTRKRAIDASVTARPSARGETRSRSGSRLSRWSARISGAVPDEPDEEGGREPHRRVDEERRFHLRPYLQRGEHLVSHRGQDHAGDRAEHPGRKERSEDVDGWAVHRWLRLCTSRAKGRPRKMARTLRSA